ncbi:WD repeat-containing protein 87-like [Glandiceps talaboti]
MPPKCKPKLLPWKHIREGILSVLKSLDCTETVSVPYGIQLAYSLHHSHTLRCMTFYVSTAGDNYVSHYDAGVSNQVQLWTINSYNDVQVQSRKFDIHPTIMTIMFVPQHRVFVGFCNDLHMRIFSDAKHKISELSSTPCSTTILCMAFNEVTDELITGGYGVLQSWKMTHVEIRGPLLPSRPIQCDLSRYQWVTNLKLDKKNHQLLALCDDGVFIINYKTNKQTHFIKNWHATSLSCCVFYRPFEYFITASKDGSIKVWNAVVFSIVHEFIGHHNHVTGLALHSSDPLLISSSKDGTIRIWRLDTLEETFRLDLGEMIYGLKLGSNQQLYCYTLQDIKIWNFNQFHHLFTPIQSCVHKLASVKSVGIPSRILCVAEDGSVRLLSSVSGTVITIIYPMATYQILTDIVYDPRNARIYIALATGEVLLFDSSTNPCSAYQLWVPHLPDDAVLCLALVKLNNALGDIDTVNGESIIFAGHCNGQITLMEAETVFMKSPIQAHCGRVVTLEQSHGFHRNNNAIGDRDYLLSIGTDKLVKLWVISRQDSNLTLTILYTVECQVCPTHVSMLGSVIALTMPNNEIKMYKVEKENGDQSAGDGNGEIGVNELTHHKDDNHTQQITALCSCPKLGLFASTSCDGSVKIWNKENQLVRELCLDGTVRGVCFANDRGDLLVGFQNHVSYIPIVNYLPQSVLEKIVIEEFPDEPIEEALEFNPDLQLWFDIHNLLALPTDLTSRHLMTKLLEKYKSVTTQETEETPVQTPSQEDIKRTLSDIAESEPEITLSTEQMDQLTALSAYSLDRITKSPSKIISTVTIPSTTVSRLSTSLDTIDSRFTVSSTSSVYLIIKDSELDTVDSFVQMEDEGKEDIVKEEEVVEKEKKTPWPIAPDGYIPNSVIRALMGYKPPPIQPLPVPWKLKPVISAVTVTPTEIEVPSKTPSPLFSDEPFEWASLSSSEVCRESDMDEMDMEDTVVDPSLPMATRKKSMSMTMKQKMFRKLSLKPVSEGISVPRWRKVEEEEEEETEEIEETVEEEVIPPLLIKISTSPWFPANEKVTKANVVRVLIDLLGKVTAFQYRGVCQALLDIYRLK